MKATRKSSKSAALSKSLPTKRAKAIPVAELAEVYGLPGVRFTKDESAQIEAWAKKRMTPEARNALARLTVQFATKPEKAMAIPIEAQHAVALARLKDANERVETALCDITTAIERFSAAGVLAYDAAENGDKDGAWITAIQALALKGGEDLHDVRTNLEGLDLLANIAAEDVAALEATQAAGGDDEG